MWRDRARYGPRGGTCGVPWRVARTDNEWWTVVEMKEMAAVTVEVRAGNARTVGEIDTQGEMEHAMRIR